MKPLLFSPPAATILLASVTAYGAYVSGFIEARRNNDLPGNIPLERYLEGAMGTLIIGGAGALITPATGMTLSAAYGLFFAAGVYAGIKHNLQINTKAEKSQYTNTSPAYTYV